MILSWDISQYPDGVQTRLAHAWEHVRIEVDKTMAQHTSAAHIISIHVQDGHLQGAAVEVKRHFK